MPAARFTLITPGCVRIEYSPGATAGEAGSGGGGWFVEAPTLLAAYRDRDGTCFREPQGAPVVVEDRAGAPPFVLETERFRLVYTPDGTGLSERTLRVTIRGPFAPGGPEGGETLWTPGAPQRGNLGGTICTLDGVRGPVPLTDGLLSRDGWCFLDDSGGHLLTDGWVRPRDPEPGASDGYLLAYGRDFNAGLRAFTALSGPVPLPRRRLLGSWYSRYWPHTSEEFRQIVRDYETHGIPLDVVVLDMDWHRDGWTGWSWNRALLPDAEDLLAWLHARGLAVTLNLHPSDGVGPHEDRYGDFMRALGQDPASGRTIPFDAGDRRQMGALFGRVIRPLESPEKPGAGVDFWWLDWQQEKFVRSIPGLTNLQWLNRLFFEHTRSPAPGGDGAGVRRGVSFSRWAGDPRERRWGDHRHPIHFSGDAHTGWPMLAFQVPFTTTAGNVGCFFWSHDIGGHFGPRIEEATARWVQFGALSAAMRPHSARSGVLDRRPWTYQERFFGSMRAAFRLRARLMPYIYTQVHRSCDGSTPLLRPMYIDRPGEPRAYDVPGQYLFGSDLLAAPIVRPGVGDRCVGTQGVWFPPLDGGGRAWRHWRTGERFPAGDEAITGATIEEAPLYVPEGVPVPLAPPGPRSADGLGDELHVRLWPSPTDGAWSSELVEDDGLTDDPRRERVARTPITAEWSATPGGQPGDRRLRLTIGPTFGAFAGQPASRRYQVEVGGVAGLVHAEADGRRLAGEIDSHRTGGRLTLRLAERSIREGASATIDLTPADAERLTVAVAARRLGEALGRSLAGSPERDAPDALRHAVIAECHSSGGEHATDALAIGAGIGLVPRGGGGAYRLCDTFGWVDRAEARVEVVDRVGPRALGRSDRTIALTGGGRSRAGDFELPPDALAEPPLGLRASRQVRAEFAVGGRALSISACVSERVRALPASVWRAVGPFPWDWARSVHDQAFSPEQGGGRGLRWHDWHDATNGSWVTWIAARGSEKWPVDLRLSLNSDVGVGYALTRITSSRRQTARLLLDTSDKAEVWLNAKKVYSLDGFDTPAALEGGATVALPQGRSTLLVKCAVGGGGWGFSMAIDGEREVGADADPDESVAPATPRSG